MRRPACVSLLAAMVLLAACGGGKAAPAPTSTSTPIGDAAFKAFAQPAADGAVLARADFPAEWVSNSADGSHGALSLTPQCSEINDIQGNISYKGAIAEARSLVFSATDAGDEQVTSDVGVYRDESPAQQEYQHFVDLIRMCRTELASAFELNARLAGATYAFAKVNELPTTRIADSSTAFAITIEVGGPRGSASFESRVVVMRYGRVDGSVSYGLSPQLTQTDADAYTTIVANRLRDANDALPGANPNATPAAHQAALAN